MLCVAHVVIAIDASLHVHYLWRTNSPANPAKRRRASCQRHAPRAQRRIAFLQCGVDLMHAVSVIAKS